MQINWRVRLMSSTFWATIIPAIMLIIQMILQLLGVEVDLGEIGNRILDVINSILALMTAFGVIIDPTTKGVNDSDRAMTYVEPN